MNVCSLTARIAGIESTAKMTSLVSMTTRTANSGVASFLPLMRTNIDWPWYSGVDGTLRRTSLSTGLSSGWISSSLCRSSRMAVRMRNPPNTKSIHSKLCEQLHADEDEDEAEHEGAEHAPEQHPELIGAGHREVAHDDGPHEDVVDRQALLDQVARDVLAGRLPAPGSPDDEREGHADRDPDGGLDGCFLRRDDVGRLVDEEQVGDEEADDDGEERSPHPKRHVELSEVPLAPALSGESGERGEYGESQEILRCSNGRWMAWRQGWPVQRPTWQSELDTGSRTRSRAPRGGRGRSTRGRRRARRTPPS